VLSLDRATQVAAKSRQSEFDMSDQTYSRLHDQCVFETRIATILRAASRTERTKLYSELYDAYAEAFPESVPGATDKADRNIDFELAFAKRFVSADAVVAEVGPGRCAFAISLARYCNRVYGVDVVDQSPRGSLPANFELVLTDGIHIPLPDQSVDVVVSNQMIEHLHPEDAADQVKDSLRVLRTGGCYLCITPNRLNGPHDTSARFDDLSCPIVDGSYVANGLHLKEYTNSELSQLFLEAGFRTCRHFVGARGIYVRVPLQLMGWCEHWVRRIPVQLRKRSRLLRVLLGVRIVASK
jgi:SAM-dependent methyltransferase